jgi:MoxR-like ATPase
MPINPTQAQTQQPAQQSQAQTQQPAQSPVVANPKFDSQINFMGNVIDNMLSGANKRLMIGGDTGLGKTSFVKQFAKIFGFPTVIVEIPHTVEEQLINIPFIVYDTAGQKHQGYDQIEKEQTRVELGSSHLASTLRKLSKVPDPQYPALINSYDPFVQELIKQFEEANPGEIALVRSRYERILFLDEYYRQTTPAIRNILRNVLNGKIGNDEIPPGTYVMYASNLEDVGGSMDTQSQHTSFINKKFAAPSKEQWLSYTVSSAIGKKVQFNQAVIDAFNKNLSDEHISYNDVDTGLRTSPRRWSEILLYINNAFPFKSPSEAGILLTTIKRQFQDDGKNTSAVFEVLRDIIVDLSVKSKIDPKVIKEVRPTEWRKVLAQQIMTSITVGESKKYVPVIQGLPGVGKTAIGKTFEKPPYNLRFISILATTLTRDSVIGIPLSDDDKQQRGVKFAEPELYIMIKNQIKDALDNYKQRLSAEEKANELNGKTADEVYRDYQQQRYKYIIFFDEINRVKDISIFNSLRRVILEKEFNDQYKLPKEALILGAMNPTDLGTQPLTAHFRDAIDLIDVEASWSDTIKYIKNYITPYLKKLNKPSDISLETALTIIEQFPGTFSDKKRGRASNEFYINVGVEEVYLSPRDYDNLYRELVAGIDRSTRKLSRQLDKGQSLADDAINSEIAESAFEKMEGTLSERFYQAQIGDPPGFFDKVRQFLDSIINVSLTKSTKNLGLAGILSNMISTPLKDSFDFDNYMASYMPATFRKDFDQFLNDIPATADPAELVSIATQFAEAVAQNDFEPGILDQVDDAMFENLNARLINETKGSTNIAAYAEKVGKAYQNILDTLGR